MGCRTGTSALALVLVNLLLLGGGVVVLVVTLRVRGTAWVDVLRSYASATDTVLTALEVVAGVVIALAALGLVAALCRWRLGLLLYSCASALLLLAFAAAAVAAFLLRGTARDWAGAAFPAAADESAVAREFERVYCAAQGAYVCTELSLADAVAMFAPQLNASALLPSGAGVGALCAAQPRLLPELDAVCAGCAAASALRDLSGVLDWANEQCPRTAATLLWCGAELAAGAGAGAAVAGATAPYAQCRTPFLDLVASTALYVAVGSVVVSAGALLAASGSCYLRRRGARASESESSDEDVDDPYTPTAARAMYTKA